MVSRCLLLPFTLEVNSSSWQATFIALLVLRGDNHHIRSLALEKKRVGGQRGKERLGTGRTTRSLFITRGKDRMSHKSSSCVWRVTGESTPTAPQGRSLGEFFHLEVGPEADSGKPHLSESLTPREWVSVCATLETSYNSYLLFPILLRLPPQTPLLLPFFLYFSPLPLPWTLARSTASSPALP